MNVYNVQLKVKFTVLKNVSFIFWSIRVSSILKKMSEIDIFFFKDVLKRAKVDMCLASLFAKWPGGLLSEISFC